MFAKSLEFIKEPLFWAAFAAIMATIFNLLLYRINQKTFKILYSKPLIRIKEISIPPSNSHVKKSIKMDYYIKADIINASCCEISLLARKLSLFPFLQSIESGNANITIKPFSRHPINISLNGKNIGKYMNKYLLLSLEDLKGRKIHKIFKLKSR